MIYTHPDKVSPVRLLTDTERMDWLTQHGTYFEFGDRDDPELCYDAEAHRDDPDGIPLRDFIDQCIRSGK